MSNGGRWLFLVLVLGLAAAVGVWWLTQGSPMDEGVSPVSPGRSGIGATAETTKDPEERSTTQPSGPATVEQGSESERTDGAEPDGAIEIRGLVIDAASGAPLTEHTVTIAHPEADREEISTDDSGAFRLALDPEAWTLGAYVAVAVATPNGERLSSMSVPLERELVLRVKARLRMRGRLTTNPPLRYETVSLKVVVPPSPVREHELFSGLTTLEATGHFQLLAPEPTPTDTFELVFHDGSSSIGSARVSKALLTSGEGPAIQLDLAVLELVTETAAGRAVPGAELRIFPRGESGGTRWTVSKTDDAGKLSLHMQAGEYELCASHEGHLAAVETLSFGAPGTVFHRITLRPISDDDLVRGTVLSAQGKPVQDALVTAMPVTENPDVAVAGSVQSRTDQAGRFALAIAKENAVEITAYHRDHGLAERPATAPGDGDVLLRFTPGGKLVVTPVGASDMGPVANGPMSWFVCSEEGKLLQGTASVSPFAIDAVPPGELRLFLFHSNDELYGEATLSVRAGESLSVEVDLQAGGYLFGRVTDEQFQPIEGLRVQLTGHGSWPDELVQALGTVTDARGVFRLRAGTGAAPRFGIFRRGRRLQEHTGDLGLRPPRTYVLRE